MSEGAVIGVIVLDGAVSLRHHFFESLHCKDSLINSEVTHEMNVDEVTYMITEGGTSPNATAC